MFFCFIFKYARSISSSSDKSKQIYVRFTKRKEEWLRSYIHRQWVKISGPQKYLFVVPFEWVCCSEVKPSYFLPCVVKTRLSLDQQTWWSFVQDHHLLDVSQPKIKILYIDWELLTRLVAIKNSYFSWLLVNHYIPLSLLLSIKSTRYYVIHGYTMLTAHMQHCSKKTLTIIQLNRRNPTLKQHLIIQLKALKVFSLWNWYKTRINIKKARALSPKYISILCVIMHHLLLCIFQFSL